MNPSRRHRGLDSEQRVRLLTLFATALGSALAFLDTTVVIVALPAMDDDIGLGLAGQQWVYLAYALSLSAFYLIGGAIGDRWGSGGRSSWGSSSSRLHPCSRLSRRTRAS